MNAKEAKVNAQKRAAELKEKREAAERKSAEEHAKKWREERADWFKNELAWVESAIAEAVSKGKDKTHIHLATFDEREQAQEKVFWERFAFKPELKKVIAHFEDLGYELKFAVKERENIDLSDLSPRDNWFTYRWYNSRMRKTVRRAAKAAKKLFEKKKYSWEGRKHTLPIDQDLWDLTQQYVKDQIALMARHGSQPDPPLTDAQYQDLVYATAKYPQQVRNLRKKYERPEDETGRANAV